MVYPFNTLWSQQPSLEVFGKNRVQYQRFDWKFYESKHFKVYFYERAGRTLARYVTEQAEKDLSIIEQQSGALFNDKLSIILYNSYDHFMQSNIGLNSELQMQNNNPAGTVNMIGEKLVLYFTGEHFDLKRQIRQGMARMVVERLMYGENFKEKVRNAVVLDLPTWIMDGYVDYIVDGWTAKDENDWKNLIFNEKNNYFNELSIENPRLAGKAFWKYIEGQYGSNTIREILFYTQQKGDINKALKLSIGMKIKEAYDTVMVFYQEKYRMDAQQYHHLDTANAFHKIPIPDNETEIRNILVSPRGSNVAYVEWKHGTYTVKMETTNSVSSSKKKTTAADLLSGGVKDLEGFSDPNYPLLGWNNTGYKLGIIYNKRNHLYIKIYDALKSKIQTFRIPDSRFDRVTGFTFMEDDNFIVLSAIKNGQSDLFQMRLRGAFLTQITNDEWDDVSPIYVSGGSRKGIVFLSNRPEPYVNIQPLPNELPVGLMNAYFYSTTTKSYDLLTLTREESGTIRDIIPFGDRHFAYLSDKSGITNRYVILWGRTTKNEDSAFSIPVTNYDRGIQYQQYNLASNKATEVIRFNNAYYVYFKDITIPQTDDDTLKLPISSFVDGVRGKTKIKSSASKLELDGTDSPHQKATVQRNESATKLLKKGDYFQTEFSSGRKKKQQSTSDQEKNMIETDIEEKESLQTNLVEENDTTDISQPLFKTLTVDSTYLTMRPKEYKASFKPDFLSLRLDNSVIFNRYQSYTNTGGQYINPNLSGMLVARLYDKMEDYRFTGGIQLPTNFSGITYYFQFENFRRRIDWSLVYLRSAQKLSYNFGISGTNNLLSIPGKTITSIFQGNAHYPIDRVKGFNYSIGLRQDQMIVKASDFYGVLLPNVQDYWWMNRLEFVYDDTKYPTMNIHNGMRMKVYGEFLYKIYTNNKDIYSLSENPYISKGGFFNVGVDYRYYQKIYKNFIAAFRVAGAHSLGRQQIVYFLGGKENAMNAQSEMGMPPSPDMHYAFQSLANNLRGYNQNARNGNTYALVNSELRLPILPTIFRRPFQSAFLNNLQAIAFVDVGSAWEGLLPTKSNLNRNYHLNWPPNSNSPVINVEIPNPSTDYLALGYGAGLRSLVFGYFLGVDFAWNIDRKFHWYLSIGMDF